MEMTPVRARNAAKPTIADDPLVAAAQGGDVEAFGLLYDRHRDRVYFFILNWIGRRDDAEDLLQEVFCRAWRSIGGFRGDSGLLSWLCKIAVNLCRDAARRAARERRIELDTSADIDEDLTDLVGPSAEDQGIARHLVREALVQLPETQRMLVVLCDAQGFTSLEAARILGCSHVSARVRLCKARKRLRELLADLAGGH